jgi:hypothetical protein
MNILSVSMNKMRKNTSLWSKQFQNLISKISEPHHPQIKQKYEATPFDRVSAACYLILFMDTLKIFIIDSAADV